MSSPTPSGSSSKLDRLPGPEPVLSRSASEASKRHSLLKSLMSPGSGNMPHTRSYEESTESGLMTPRSVSAAQLHSQDVDLVSWSASLQADSNWKGAIGMVREELLARSAGLSAALKEQASSFKRELKLHRVAQNKVSEEQVIALRHEAEISIQAEREARLWDSADLHAIVQSLQARVGECQTKLANVPSLLERELPPESQHLVLPQSFQVDLQDLIGELQAERETRSSRDADLHDRLGREVGVLARRLEEHRVALAEDMADTIEHMDQQWLKLDRSFKAERRDRCHDVEEIRAILKSVWQQAQDLSSKATGVAKRAKLQEQEADQQDIDTVYEMAREALGDIVHLRKQLVDEQDSRRREQQQTERDVKTIKALLNDAKEAPPAA